MTSSPAEALERRRLVRGLARYGPILRAPAVSGALGFSIVGRLHESMISFGVIMLVTHRSTYAAAGVVMAAFGAGGLAAGPVNSRLAARHGHVPVLLVTAVLYATGVVAMAVAGAEDLLVLGLLGGFAGLMTPPLTPALRSTLPRLVRREERLSAFALESTLQETVFIAGPVLAGVVAGVAGPRAALVVAAAATLLGTLGYCVVTQRAGAGTAEGSTGGVHGTGETDAGPRGHTRLLTATVLRLLCGGIGFLVTLCIVAVAVIAQVSGPAAQGRAGIVLGISSVGSMVGGVVFGATVTATSGLRRRYVLMALAVTAVAGVAALTDAGEAGPGVVVLAVAVFAYGLTIAPVATVLFGRLSSTAGDARATEAFGWMGAAMGIGGVLGDASGGWLVTALPVWATLVAAAAVALATAAVVPNAADRPHHAVERPLERRLRGARRASGSQAVSATLGREPGRRPSAPGTAGGSRGSVPEESPARPGVH